MKRLEQFRFVVADILRQRLHVVREFARMRFIGIALTAVLAGAIVAPAIANGLTSGPFVDISSVTLRSSIAVGGLNNAGEIVGTGGVLSSSVQHAFIFSPFNPAFGINGFMDLGALGGPANASSGAAIGDLQYGSGALPNPYVTGQSMLQAYRWHGNPMLPIGGKVTSGKGIDVFGNVAGQAFNSTVPADYSIVWPINGSPLTPLPTDGSTISAAEVIGPIPATNVAGTLVAGFQTTAGGAQGFVYNSTSRRIYAFPPLPGDTTIVPRTINTSALLIAGNSYGSGFKQHAFVSDICVPSGLPACLKPFPFTTALPTLGGMQSFANAVNRNGFIAGYAQTPTGASHAVVWRPTGTAGRYQAYDLNALGLVPASWTLSDAIGINDQGLVVGYGSKDGGKTTSAFALALYDQGIDTSYSAPSIQAAQADLLASIGRDFFAVELYAPKAKQLSSAAPNLQRIQSHSYRTAGYVFLEYDDPVAWSGTRQMQAALSCTPSACGAFSKLEFIALDVEHNCPAATAANPHPTCYDNPASPLYPRATWKSVRQKVIGDAIRAAPRNMPVVLYTSRSAWTDLVDVGNGAFGQCALWDTVYDNLGDLVANDSRGSYVPFSGYGGWHLRFAKQYEADNGPPPNPPKGPDVQTYETFSHIPALDLDTFDWLALKNGRCFGST